MSYFFRRKLFYISVVLLSIIGFNSCCTKKDCDSTNDIREIAFVNFSQAELDTIHITGYERKSNFRTAVDTINVRSLYSYGNQTVAYLDKILNTDLDFKIEMGSGELIYLLTDLEIERRGCNSCFPFRPESDYYFSLRGYKVNGTRSALRVVEINK